MFLDDTACNLASLNLMHFRTIDGELRRRGLQARGRRDAPGAGDHRRLLAATRRRRSTAELARLPPAGPGLRQPGRAADGDAACPTTPTRAATTPAPSPRSCAARPTRSRRGSPSSMGPFAGYAKNARADAAASSASTARRRTSCATHGRAARAATRRSKQRLGRGAARWASEHGYRNSQVTVLAPTGTIGFMMDCDTTGIEPDIALIKYKKLVGGGMLKIVNNTVPARAAASSATRAAEVEAIVALPRRERDHRGRAGPQGRAPAGVRLRVQAGQGRAQHPLHGPPQDDGRRPAVPLGRHLQDGQPAQRRHRRGHRAGVPRGVEAGAQGGRGLPRRLQAQPAAQHLEEGRGGEGRGRARSPSSASARRRLPDERAGASPTSSRIAGHEGYLTVGHVRGRHAGRALLRDGQGGLGGLGPDGQLRHRDLAGAAVRRAAAGAGATSSATPASSPRASPATRTSRSPSRSPTTSSAGWR